ncbi:MAG: efflux RND transporter permease subunit [Desulfoprunum sp.]
MRVPGEFQTPEEIYGLVIGTHKGEPVCLKDVARVVDGFKEENSISRLNGRDAVNLAIKKRAGENIIAISRAVDRIIATGRTAWPQATEVTKVLDKSRDIEMMIADLENNILSGLVLVLLVIFLSMGFRNAILVSLAIPFSMLISFTILYAMGITLNMVVLFSLTLALGMLVDNAIVIIENSYRFMQQRAGRVEQAVAGVRTEPGEQAPAPLAALAPKEHRRSDGGTLAGSSDLYNVKDIYMQGTISAGGGASFSSNAPQPCRRALSRSRGPQRIVA